MSELITDEMVERIARRRYEDHVRIDKYPQNWPTWEDFHGVFKESVVAGARAEAEAIAPLIAGRALSLAADDWQRGEWADAPRYADRVKERLANAQHVTNWLRARSEKEAGRG